MPKYSRPEFERRFHVIAEHLPPLDPAAARLIEDRYIGGMPGEPIVNMYLSAAEYAVLAALPGRDLVKRRFQLDVAGTQFAVDIFEHPHAGLILCEVEAESLVELARVALPVWAGTEVADDPNFTGAALAGH